MLRRTTFFCLILLLIQLMEYLPRPGQCRSLPRSYGHHVRLSKSYDLFEKRKLLQPKLDPRANAEHELERGKILPLKSSQLKYRRYNRYRSNNSNHFNYNYWKEIPNAPFCFTLIKKSKLKTHLAHLNRSISRVFTVFFSLSLSYPKTKTIFVILKKDRQPCLQSACFSGGGVQLCL